MSCFTFFVCICKIFHKNVHDFAVLCLVLATSLVQQIPVIHLLMLIFTLWGMQMAYIFPLVILLVWIKHDCSRKLYSTNLFPHALIKIVDCGWWLTVNFVIFQPQQCWWVGWLAVNWPSWAGIKSPTKHVLPRFLSFILFIYVQIWLSKGFRIKTTGSFQLTFGFQWCIRHIPQVTTLPACIKSIPGWWTFMIEK